MKVPHVLPPNLPQQYIPLVPRESLTTAALKKRNTKTSSSGPRVLRVWSIYGHGPRVSRLGRGHVSSIARMQSGQRLLRRSLVVCGCQRGLGEEEKRSNASG